MADLKLVPPDLKENVIAVTALARLRRDVAFRIAELEKRTEGARADLVHIDAVIRMLAPTFDPTAIAERKRHPRRLEYFSHGEISRRCFDALRDGATIQAVDDEATAWNELHARYTLHRINHQEAYSLLDDAKTHTNNAEGYFSRLRRGEIGHHHHVAGPYLIRFAQEAAWREDHRRDPNGTQVDRIVRLAMLAKPSVDFCGYWQRGRGV